MSEEIKKNEEIEKVAEAGELVEGSLEKVAGGKSYLESRSNIYFPSAQPIVLPVAGGAVAKAGAVKVSS